MSFGTKFLEKKKKNSRCIETSLNRQVISDTIASLCYAMRMVNEWEDVVDVEFDMNAKGKVIPIKIYFNKKKKEPTKTNV